MGANGNSVFYGGTGIKDGLWLKVMLVILHWASGSV